MKLLFPSKLKQLGLLAASVWAIVSLSSMLSSPLFAQIPPSSAESPADPCVSHNFQVQGEVIILGKIPDAPYVVVVPLRGDADILAAVQQCVEDSLQLRSRLGKYVQAGAFAERSAARQLTRHLRSLGLDARTVYLH
jgi:hypothetical protein